MATPGPAGIAAPLPAVSYYGGTMSYADIYPTHVGIGGITTQDSALPAFGERLAGAQSRAISGAQPMHQLLGAPAGYLALAVVALVVLAHLI